MRELPSQQLNPKVKNVWRINDALWLTVAFLCCFVPFACVRAFEPSAAGWSTIVLIVLAAVYVVALVVFLAVLPPIRYARWRYELSEDYLEGYIDDVVAWLGSAVERNDAVWGYSYDASQLPSTQRRTPDPGQTLAEVNPGSYREAVGWMKGYMIARGEWLDEHIDALLQHCQGSRTAAQRVE